MSLIKNVEIMMNRSLTQDELKALNNIQRMNHIDDSDPLLLVVAFMARSQMMLESLPNELEKMVKDTIEQHRTGLRDQSNLIAKDLILSVALGLEKSNKFRKFDFFSHIITFSAGSILTGILFVFIKHL